MIKDKKVQRSPSALSKKQQSVKNGSSVKSRFTQIEAKARRKSLVATPGDASMRQSKAGAFARHLQSRHSS